MTKNSKRKPLLLTLFLMMLFISSTYAVLIPNVHAAEISNQQKGLTILNDAVGFDLAKYTTVSREYPQESFMDVAQSENVGYNLESDASKVKVHCTFTNGALHILQVLEREGTPILTKSVTDARDMAKDFLSNYQHLSDNSFYGKLSSTLNNVDDTKNSTTVLGNIKFEVTTSETRKSYVWSYTFNGIEAARKCVALKYQDGFLKYFVDTWDLYKVGSTEVNLSEEEAVTIAMEQAKAFSWKIVDGNDTIEITNFKVTKAAVKYLVFGNSINADNERGEDRLMLYPMWRIGVELDKYYPGDVYGIYVDIWADTGEIRNIQEVVSTLPPSDAEFASIEESTGRPFADEAIQNLPSTTWIALLAPAVLVIGSVWITKKKNLPKRYYKIAGVLLCILIYALILPITVSTANATELKARATIWGSEAPPKIQEELDKQELICFYINNWFTWSSYVTHNYQGTGTTKGALLQSIHVSEGVYPFVATVWFDHGPGEQLDFPGHPDEWHFMLRDSDDVQIYDYDIGQQTTGKTFFAFISVCMSARLDLTNPLGGMLGNGEYGNSGNNYKNPIGMPYAWTHGADLSTDGYDQPDSGPYCYIGFPWGSAALDQEIDPDYAGVKYYEWVFTFFGAVLNDDMSVNDALDHASLMRFPSQDFGDTDLHTGFTTKWPNLTQYGGCTMEVYGNGDIHLQYPVDVQAYDNNDQYVHSKVTVDGYASYGSTFGWVRAPAGTHLIGVENNPDDWRTFTHFEVDGAVHYENPIAVNVNSRPTITAYYDAAEVPYSFVSSIYDYDWYGQAGVDSPENMIGTTNDGQYATLYAGYQPSQAWIIGEMYTQATGRIKLYGYSSVNSYVHVYVSNDGSNYDLVVEGYNPPSSPRWIDCGTYSSPFKYIAIAVSTDYVPADIAIDSVRVEPPTNYTLTVSSSGGGYTDPTGNIEYPYYTYAHVQAYAAPGWQLDHWLLDNENAGNEPSIDVYMDKDHILQAVFCEEPLQHSLTVLAYNQYGQPGSVPLYIDGQYVGTTGYAYTVTSGNHQIYVESPLFDGYYYHVFQYYYYDGNYNYDNPMTLSVTEDKTVTAYYYSYYW